MAETELTAEEVFDSVTGFDEIAIAQHFGRTISELANDDTMFARALAFVVKRRDGMSDDDARNAVLGMALKDVAPVFAEASEDEVGKEPEPVERPESSLSSVS